MRAGDLFDPPLADDDVAGIRVVLEVERANGQIDYTTITVNILASEDIENVDELAMDFYEEGGLAERYPGSPSGSVLSVDTEAGIEGGYSDPALFIAG